ncbi:alpha/beta-hydrolase [Mollisia scopiformis]|uniref:Alpha/beta-hydrolase n=1 Tax=Mollisia scopiformis TaxID=149040 RepID=A0A194XTA3_MOLSC|nr:alpha/beta-hydrolase [Mollisia scopiformis]KUJ23279.1 alpha/beta-hydrolase [Mollisia scopiformis]
MTSTLTHSSLGEIRGKFGDGVIQFWGIKYASIKDLFAPSELLKGSSDNVVDATKYGPMVPSPMEKAWEDEFTFIQKSLPMPKMSMSELEGLHLNVTMPLIDGKVPSPETKLPVFVFVHGGGFGLGSNAWPHYDQARFVKLSAEMQKPVIGVGINYRVGIPGFMTSAELRDAGYLGNNGIRDQANAFTWVQEYISGFRGDPQNVTFIGESAGSASGFLLLHQTKPLFNRFISMSGNTLMMRPLPPPLSEFVYSSTMQALGLGALSGSERVKSLWQIPVEKIVEAGSSGLPLLPVVDNDSVPCAPTFAQVGSKAEDPALSMPGRSWCKELLVGDCQFDGSILSFMLGPRKFGLARTFCDSIEKTFAAQPGAAEKLRHTYKITPDLSDSVALRNVLQFATDIGFFATGVTWARGWPGKAWMYHFNELNPWDGEWKGESGHVLDVAYLFQNFDEHLAQAEQAVAKQFAGDFINFMNGETRWPLFESGNEGAMTYGPSSDGKCSEYVEGITSEKSGRKNTIFELADSVGIEELSAAWGNFLSGN